MNTHEGGNYWGKTEEQTIFYWPQEPECLKRNIRQLKMNTKENLASNCT